MRLLRRRGSRGVQLAEDQCCVIFEEDGLVELEVQLPRLLPSWPLIPPEGVQVRIHASEVPRAAWRRSVFVEAIEDEDEEEETKELECEGEKEDAEQGIPERLR